MTGHTTRHTRWEARRIEDAVIAILGACLETRAPGRTTCPDCHAPHRPRHPVPHLHRTTAPPTPAAPQPDRLDQRTPGRGPSDPARPEPPEPPVPTRTADPAPRRATVTARTGRTTVTTGPSAFGNADGPGRWQRPGAISRHARVTEKIRLDSEVTAVPQGTCMPSARDRGTPWSRREVAT